MARIEIKLGTPPSGQDGDPVRTAFEKVNTMTSEIYAGPAGRQVIANPMDNTAGRLLTVGAFGLGGPAVVLPTFDFNGSTVLPDGNYYTDAPVNGPGPLGWWSVTNNAAPGYTTYEFNSLDGSTKWTRVRSGGVLQGWKLLVYAGDFGMGTLYGMKLPGNNAQQSLPNARYWTPSEWTGSPFPGQDGRNQGFLDVATWNDSSYTRQRWSPIIPSYGAPRTRYFTASAWQGWVIDPTMATVDIDPQLLTGGLMSQAVVSGMQIFKFYSGLIIITGTLMSQTQQCSPNVVTTISVDLPVSVGDLRFSAAAVQAIPLVVYDHYGAVHTQPLSPTQIQVGVRNGSTTQPFVLKGIITGNWK